MKSIICFLACCATLGSGRTTAATVEEIAQQAQVSTVWITYDHTNSNTGAIGGATGTGFIVDRAGHVLTAYHVVKMWIEQLASEQASHPLLGRIGSINSPAPIGLQVVGYDAQSDLAILKLRYPNAYQALRLCFIPDLSIGTAIVAFGFPVGHELTPFPGLISNTDAPEGRWSANVDFEEGVSGGPVFSMSGRVVGLVKGGYGDVTSIRYITQAVRASSMLANIGVRDDCLGPSPMLAPSQKASLRVGAQPDTVGIASGGYAAVDYRFDEEQGISVQIETEDVQYTLPSGDPIGQGWIGGRILGGSFQVNGRSNGTYHNNIYLPPEISRLAKARGQQFVQLRLVFHCRDANGNIFQIPAILKVVLL